MSTGPVATIDTKAIEAYVSQEWDSTIVPSLVEFIKIPNQSPLYDAEIFTNGYQEQAVKLITDWIEEQKVPGLQLKVVAEPNRTPLIFAEIPATGDNNDSTILMYGHMDKQPPMTGWDEGLGPWTPKIIEGKLYGRGAADDGYAAFGAITAIQALKAQNVPHARIVLIIEGCEESGSADLPYYIDLLKDDIGTPNLVVCLDSGCGNYDQLWLTSSLRGVLAGDLKVEIIKEGVHSGSSSGIVPSSFRIMRQLLDRIEDSKTGEMLVPEAYVEIPEIHQQFAAKVAEVLGDEVFCNYPWLDTSYPMSDDKKTLILNRTWRPTVSYTGVDGIPHVSNAGNVLRQFTTLKLSIRMPPTLKAQPLIDALKAKLESNPPYGAKVTMNFEKCGPGWMAPLLSPWLAAAGERASQAYFGKEMLLFGEGGSIPFMGMLGEKFPGTQFVITGVLGPKSNAHGPNEFLHIQMGKRVTASVASLVADHFVNTSN